ncbi:MAG: hypothetical protein MZU91_05340 [Desulfosudis oleivorans]|nr:hypothetical protein [Desulfosudis oleivorans]
MPVEWSRRSWIRPSWRLLPSARRAGHVRTTPAAEAPRTTHDMAAYHGKEIARELALEEQQYREKMPPAPPAKASGDEVPAESELTRMSPPEKNQSAASPRRQSPTRCWVIRPFRRRLIACRTCRARRRSRAGAAPFTFDQPVSINADSLEYDNKNNSATFRGNVVVRQGEIVMFARYHRRAVRGKKRCAAGYGQTQTIDRHVEAAVRGRSALQPGKKIALL